MGHVRFTVQACADPQTLPRLVNHVAQLGFVPKAVRARADDDMMTVVIDQPDIADAQAGIIAEKMRSSVLVQSVTLVRGRRSISSFTGNAG